MFLTRNKNSNGYKLYIQHQNYGKNSNNRIMKDHHLIKIYQVHSLSKLESKVNLIKKYQIQSLSKLESK